MRPGKLISIPLSILVALTACAVTSPVVPSEDETICQIGLLEDRVISYSDQGKYIEAETFARRALDIAEKDVGDGHPLVALELNALGWLYFRQDKYDEAEPLFKRSLTLAEQQAEGKWRYWWANHPAKRGSILGGLAGVYSERGRYDEAEPLLKRALNIYERARGPSAPPVVSVLNMLVALHKKMGVKPINRVEDLSGVWQHSFESYLLQLNDDENIYYFPDAKALKAKNPENIVEFKLESGAEGIILTVQEVVEELETPR